MVVGARVVVAAPVVSFRTLAVGASTTPVTGRPTTFWKVFRVASVRLSKLPDAPPFSVNPFLMMASWRAVTIGPASPNFGMPGAVWAEGAADTVAARAMPAGRAAEATSPVVMVASAMTMFL